MFGAVLKRKYLENIIRKKWFQWAIMIEIATIWHSHQNEITATFGIDEKELVEMQREHLLKLK